MGRPELGDDPRFRDNAARMRNVEELEQCISAWTATLTTAELLQTLQTIGVPCAKVAAVSDLIADPQIADGRHVLQIDHPKAGAVPMQGFAVHLGDSPMQLRHPPPMLGEHSSAILQEWLSMTPERIDQLRASGTI